MTAIVFLIALVLGQAAAVIELSCSDNATCIDNLAREVVKNLKQQKAVRVFDSLTIEPLGRRQARSNEGPLTRFLKNHAFSYDWGDFTFRVSKPEDRSDVLDLELFEDRSAKDVTDINSKKSSNKNVEESEVDKTPKGINRRRRRVKKKVLQAVLPMLFGMKSTAVVLFLLAIVTVLTLKAFVASKVALAVTVGMAVKKLYESYVTGAGITNPYLYSQYPIDFPSAASNAYSVSGVNPQFGSPEMFSPTALGQHPNNELLQQGDASAQSSQQAPTLLLNSTRAAERWDGKSKLLRFLEPIIGNVKSFIDPIANVFYSMPATFRGLNTDVSTTKSYEPDVVEEKLKVPREILVPQPRFIAQRKMTMRKNSRTKPKKYTELKINLDRLKHNKDLYEYIKTKKYKFNYPHTYFYPRVKYFVNPNSFIRRNVSRLVPYRIENLKRNSSNSKESIVTTSTEWKPITVFENHPILSINFTKPTSKNFTKPTPNNFTKAKNQEKKIPNKKIKKRPKRSVTTTTSDSVNQNYDQGRSYDSSSNRGEGDAYLEMFESFLDTEIAATFLKKAKKYAKSVIKESMETDEPAVAYFSSFYKMLVWSLEMIDELMSVEEEVEQQLAKNVNNSTVTVNNSTVNIQKRNDVIKNVENDDDDEDFYFWWW